MNGSKMTMQRKTILAAVKKTPPGGDYVWDGKDEDDRPLTREEMQKGVEAYRRKRGRPISATRKEQVSVRYSPEVLSYFRSTGERWQTPMDAKIFQMPHGCGFAASGEKTSRLAEEARLTVPRQAGPLQLLLAENSLLF